MSAEKKQVKESLSHSRNKNRDRYDLCALILSNPELAAYVKPNKLGEDSIDFSQPEAIRFLNKSLLKHSYGIKMWDFPEENVCPSVPQKADFIHHIADLLCENNFGKIPTGDKLTCYDIGIGASCILPIIGVTEYDWKFIGSDIDEKSIVSAEKIISANPILKEKIECRLQTDPKDVFYGIINRTDKIDLSICHPPTHSSSEEIAKHKRGKIDRIQEIKNKTLNLNLAGIANELICEGGENKFIRNMIRESKNFAENCYWFTTLVSKQSNVKGISDFLEELGASQIRVIPLGNSKKSKQIVAWTFLNKEQQKEWRLTRWQAKQTE